MKLLFIIILILVVFFLVVLFFIIHNKYKFRKSLLKQIIINNQDLYNGKACPICLEDFINHESIKICYLEICFNNKHPFHKKCLLKYLKRDNTKCPVCRAKAYDRIIIIHENRIRITIV